MDPQFTFADIQTFIAIKAVLFVFVAVSVMWVWRRWSLFWYVVLFGMANALTYAVFVNDLSLMFWGLHGDEVTIAAMYRALGQTGWVDFAFPTLPPFYPPLWFWVFGNISAWVGLTAIHAAKAAAAMTIAFVPPVTYVVSQRYWQHEKKTAAGANTMLNASVAAGVSSIALLLFLDWDAIIIKPYQFVAAIATVFLSVWLVRDLLQQRLPVWRVLVYGVVSGIIFMTYYLWLVFAAIGILLTLATYGGRVRVRVKRFAYLLAITGIGLIVASPYLYPLIHSYQNLGAENWQTTLFLADHGIDSRLSLFNGPLRWRDLWMLGGFATLVFFWRHVFVRTLLGLFLALFVWQWMGLGTMFFTMTPMQESKGYYMLGRIILAFALGFGGAVLWRCVRDRVVPQQWRFARTPVLVLVILFVAAASFFGTFTDNTLIRKQRITSRSVPAPQQELLDFLATRDSGPGPLTLHSGVTALYAYMPVHSFIYFNQHNTHPAAGFSSRRYYVDWLAAADSPESFASLSSSTPYGSIDRLIFFNSGGDNYSLYFHEVRLPTGYDEKSVAVNKELIAEPYFTRVFENSAYVVFERQSS